MIVALASHTGVDSLNESRQRQSPIKINNHLVQRRFSTAEAVQYCGGYSVLWGIASVLQRLFCTAGDYISTAGDSISTAGIASVLWRESISTAEG